MKLPVFHTDDDRTFFLVEFPVHPVFAEAFKKREVTTEVKRLRHIMTGDHFTLKKVARGRLLRGSMQTA
jgi:hypothetical protein